LSKISKYIKILTKMKIRHSTKTLLENNYCFFKTLNLNKHATTN